MKRYKIIPSDCIFRSPEVETLSLKGRRSRKMKSSYYYYYYHHHRRRRRRLLLQAFSSWYFS